MQGEVYGLQCLIPYYDYDYYYGQSQHNPYSYYQTHFRRLQSADEDWIDPKMDYPECSDSLVAGGWNYTLEIIGGADVLTVEAVNTRDSGSRVSPLKFRTKVSA
mmetsp:Transcript_7079/g.9863  ORF Transcript_7079/g.9863 Transcript_7079/m.9863 type:complete len:104 (-) Transcript_7079:1260-1571(-)